MLCVQVPIKGPDDEVVPKQRLKQLEAEKAKAKELSKKERKAEKSAEAARAQAIALMAGGDPSRAAAVPTAHQTRKEEAKKLKKRKREPEPEVVPAAAAVEDDDEDESGGAAVGGAEADTDDDGTPAEPVASGQYEELRQQYELVKDELDAEEKAELEAELAELYEMEGDPTGRGVEGAVMELPAKKGKKGKKKRKAKADGAAEAELSSMLAVADQVAEQQNVNVDKVVGKEEAKLAYVAIPTMQASHCRASLHQVYPLLCTCTAAGSPVSAAVTHTVLLRA